MRPSPTLSTFFFDNMKCTFFCSGLPFHGGCRINQRWDKNSRGGKYGLRHLHILEVGPDCQGGLWGQHQYLQCQDKGMQELQHGERVCKKDQVLSWQEQPQDVGELDKNKSSLTKHWPSLFQVLYADWLQIWDARELELINEVQECQSDCERANFNFCSLQFVNFEGARMLQRLWVGVQRSSCSCWKRWHGSARWSRPGSYVKVLNVLLLHWDGSLMPNATLPHWSQ